MVRDWRIEWYDLCLNNLQPWTNEDMIQAGTGRFSRIGGARICHYPETVAQAGGDNLHGTILPDSGDAMRGCDGMEGTHKHTVRRRHLPHKRHQLLGLPLTRDNVMGFQMYVQQAYHSPTALYIDHLHGAVGSKERR